VPGGFGDTFVAVDLSGSMDHPLSANSTLRLKEIGALFGAILADQGADVGGFGDDFQTVPMHVDTPVLQRQAAVFAIDEDVGNSTNAWKAIKHLHDRGDAVERIIVFTDMQIWDNTPFTIPDSQTVKDVFDAYRDEVSADTALYLVDLASYGDLVTPEGYENVYNISGWSEDVLSFINHAENPKGVIDEIEAFKPS
jgi:60 kDa SS-A/Ro ribonucleoprotein